MAAKHAEQIATVVKGSTAAIVPADAINIRLPLKQVTTATAQNAAQTASVTKENTAVTPNATAAKQLKIATRDAQKQKTAHLGNVNLKQIKVVAATNN